ncbi:AtpZ/AtpI family protein [Candidatus Roizmanbacteria bacterium]|nr:AtpZ/AtpI family protein [Candidatus Roizmanbacteria bacterium]
MIKKYFTFDKNLNLTPSNSLKNKKKLFKNSKSKYFDLANYTNIGYYLVTPLLFGVLLGLYLDKNFKTGTFVKLGVFVGAAGALYNLFRLIK